MIASPHQAPVAVSDEPAVVSRPQRAVIAFPKGLPGFEACRGFVLMAADDNGLQCLSSVEGPPASFIVVDPRRIQADYRCQLSDLDRRALGAEGDDALLWLALLMVEPNGAVTVNLRAPVVVNPDRMIGAQVIPYHCLYPLKHELVAGKDQ
jgi:flagellar assembly factor FliW